MPSIRFPRPIIALLISAALALVGMGMNSLVIESVTLRSLSEGEQAMPANAPYLRNLHVPQEITVNFFYRGYGNTALRLTPRYCFTKSFLVNGVEHSFPDKQPKWCGELIVDLGKELRRGDNTLVISVDPSDASWSNYSPIVGLAIGSPLFGTHPVQSIFTLVFLGSILGLIWLLLAKQGYNRLTRLILIVAYGLFLQCLQRFHEFDYSLDFEKHSPYIQFLSDHFFAPYAYTGAESWHPPLYYWLCALVAKGLELFGVFDVWSGIRMVSLTSYAVFLYFGMRTIMRVVPRPACYLALAMLAFWPSGLFSANWVYNDILFYPFYAAAFYYTLVWYEDSEASDLLNALTCCGLAFMVKTSGLVPISILGATMVCKWLSGQCTLRRLINREVLFGWIALAGGILFNFEREIYYALAASDAHTPGHLSGGGNYHPTLQSFLPFNMGDLLAHPFFVKWDDPSLWNLQLRTLLFTNSTWRYPPLASGLQLLCLSILAYILIFILTLPRRKYIPLFPLLAGFVIPFAATVAFTLITHMGSCMDFRYIQPALTAIIIVFHLSLQEAKNKDWALLYYAGYSIASLFVICSLVFFELQVL